MLLERIRDGFARLDAGQIDVFELDDLIHHYKRCARELWKFCGSSAQTGCAQQEGLSFSSSMVRSCRTGGRPGNRAGAPERPRGSTLRRCACAIELPQHQRRAAKFPIAKTTYRPPQPDRHRALVNCRDQRNFVLQIARADAVIEHDCVADAQLR